MRIDTPETMVEKTTAWCDVTKAATLFEPEIGPGNRALPPAFARRGARLDLMRGSSAGTRPGDAHAGGGDLLRLMVLRMKRQEEGKEMRKARACSSGGGTKMHIGESWSRKAKGTRRESQRPLRGGCRVNPRASHRARPDAHALPRAGGRRARGRPERWPRRPRW